jgi:hypothetical protein
MRQAGNGGLQIDCRSCAVLTLIRLNFHLSVWLSIAGGIILFNDPDLIVPDPENLFGPLRNNLLFAALILSVNQLILWFARYSRGSAPEALLMGLLFMLVGGGLEYYGTINGIPMNPLCSMIAFYIGGSHCLFFWLRSTAVDG